MANNLTGDFDVVAEFAITAANRVLAAMHQRERFPHSLALRVDDNPLPGSPHVPPYTVVGAVDAFGDAAVNQDKIGHPTPLSGAVAATNAAYSALDPVVNANSGFSAAPPVVPSHLQGNAQLQLSPPIMSVTDASGVNVTVQLDLVSRYFPDPQTSPLAEFIRGTLQVTAAVNQISSQAANVVDIDVKAASVGINFTPLWSSNPLSAADVAAVNQVIRNALQNSLLPSNTTLPSSIKYMQFKTLSGAPGAIGVLLNTQGARGNPASFSDLFLAGGDDFAFGVGRNFILSAFQPIIQNILSQTFAPVSFDIDAIFHTFHITYDITLSSIVADLQAGNIVLTIKGHAHTPTSWMPDFDFTIGQNFTLSPYGDTVNLVVGSMSLQTSSSVVDLFKSAAMSAMANMRDQALAQSGVQATIQQMLSASANLGGFLDSLLSPVPRRRTAHPRRAYTLAYTAADIQPSGIVLHGVLAVNDWPSAHVEFERVPVNNGNAGTIIGGGAANSILHPGPDYSALNTWIPGGLIQEYQWSAQGQPPPFDVDYNRFVYVHPPAELTPDAVSSGAATAATAGAPSSIATPPKSFAPVLPVNVLPAYAPICLTVKGTRLSSSGPVVAQPVTATACGVTVQPLLNGIKIPPGAFTAMVSLAQPGPGGLVQVTGTASAQIDASSTNTPNLLVHFAGDKPANLDLLVQSLQESKRDAPTAVLAVLTASQLAKTRYTPGIIYADDQNGAWRQVLGVKPAQGPVTYIVGPKGNVLGQQEGELDKEKLAASLRNLLVARAPVGLTVSRLNSKLGHPSPNFIFDIAPGRELTLRKLAGRAVILVFWKSSLELSIAAVRDLQKAASDGEKGTIVLAINDGDSADVAGGSFAQNALPGILVADPKRQIANAYGVSIWPTTISLDASGFVRNIRYGRGTS